MDSFCGSLLWDQNITWNTDSPDFTPCFEKTVLVWIPSSFLSLFSTIQIYFALKSQQGRIPTSPLGVLQQTATCILFVLQVINFAFTFRETDEPLFRLYPVDQAKPAIQASTYALAIFLTSLVKRKGIRSSAVLFVFWFLLAICSVAEFQTAIRSLPLEDQFYHQRICTVIALISYPIIVIELLLNFFADRAPVPYAGDHKSDKEVIQVKFANNREQRKPCPQHSSSIPNQFTFQWMYPFIWKGYRKTLELSDLWELSEENQSSKVEERFNKYWKPDFERAKKWNAEHKHLINAPTSNQENTNKKAKKIEKKIAGILPALWKANWFTFLVSAILRLAQDLLSLLSSQILSLLIAHLAKRKFGIEEEWKGYLYMAVLFITVSSQTLCNSNHAHLTYIIGLRLRSALLEAVYRKSLILSNSARKESTVGEIVNLMSVDVQKFQEVMTFIHSLWSTPLQVAIALYLLWQYLGVATVAGVVILVLLFPINSKIAVVTRDLKIGQMKLKDQRIRLTSEVLSGIKVLKLYAWEPAFEEKIGKIRQGEVNNLRKLAWLSALGSFISTISTVFVSVAAFATFVLIDEKNVLNAQKAFVSLTLFNIMRMPLAMLSYTISVVVQTHVSMKRLNKFMNADEINPEGVSHDHAQDGSVVSLKEGNFTWGESHETPTLRNIDLNVKRGSLIAVVGTVGSGKSSLLSAILGEMEKISGRVNTYGSIAYAAQQAWIQNATLRDNILFGRKFEPALYNRILEACALKPDLKILPGGDKTEIGEKGINLSGGQKQRVALARAVYNGADIYLLDDPLSAVDSHVGKHLFDKVIGPKGLLRKTTRIVVTHGIAYLPWVDHIIVMNNGEISESGTYNELLRNKGEFADFLAQHGRAEDSEVSNGAVDSGTEIPKRKVGTALVKPLETNLSRMEEMSERSRRDSILSTISWMSTSDAGLSMNVDQLSEVDADTDPSKLIKVETAEIGNVKMAVFTNFLRAMGWKFTAIFFLFYFFGQGVSVYSSFWLSEWSTVPTINGTLDIKERNKYLAVFGVLGAIQSFAVTFGQLMMLLGVVNAAALLHKRMLSRILRSPMSFFDVTPLGRIVNRFSKDVDVPDSMLSYMFQLWIMAFTGVFGTLVVISINSPMFLVVVAPIGIVYIVIQRFYAATSRQLKRIDSISRSPIFSNFSETLSGLSTIRAFNVQKKFLTELESSLDKNQSAYYSYFCTNRWLSILLEAIGNVIVLFAALFALLGDADPGKGGLSISYSLTITINLSLLVRATLDIETNIVAVERIQEYCEAPQEAAWDVPEEKPSLEWPQEGTVNFNNFQIRYRDDLDLVLRGLSCRVSPGEKVGIVGRTGAGKSSLTLGLFRIMEAAGGSIVIDGKDISKIGLQDLRGRLTIIPQDPVLFVGTLRVNLDPYGKYSDDYIWNALEHAHLKDFVASLPQGLDGAVNENGENFSVGQRQLVCLARALLRKTRILILDEATAAVDLETDDLIQKTIRVEFKDCTVLTIAHRLNTILDSDRVLVLDKGEVREFDNPQTLLNDPIGIFRGMAKDAGLL